MIIKFPRPLVTQQDRLEAALAEIVQINAEYFEGLGIDIDPWLEDMVELFDAILEDDNQ
jgi:hypothetical protein